MVAVSRAVVRMASLRIDGRPGCRAVIDDGAVARRASPRERRLSVALRDVVEGGIGDGLVWLSAVGKPERIADLVPGAAVLPGLAYISQAESPGCPREPVGGLHAGHRLGVGDRHVEVWPVTEDGPRHGASAGLADHAEDRTPGPGCHWRLCCLGGLPSGRQ